jgi:hypothetical protein
MRWITLIALCGAGAAWLQAASNDGDAAVAGILNDIHAVNSLGVPIVSARGKVVRFTPRSRSIFVEDPNGINVELYETTQ